MATWEILYIYSSNCYLNIVNAVATVLYSNY